MSVNMLACDPGAKGAIARFIDDELIDVIDLQASEGLVSPRMLKDDFVMADVLVIEGVHAMPKNGSLGNFKLGYNLGVIVAAAELHGLVIIRYSPAVWKKAMGLQGKDKNASRHLAMDLYPAHADQLTRVKDDNRAEAILIGHHHNNQKASK